MSGGWMSSADYREYVLGIKPREDEPRIHHEPSPQDEERKKLEKLYNDEIAKLETNIRILSMFFRSRLRDNNLNPEQQRMLDEAHAKLRAMEVRKVKALMNHGRKVELPGAYNSC